MTLFRDDFLTTLCLTILFSDLSSDERHYLDLEHPDLFHLTLQKFSADQVTLGRLNST